MQFSTRTVAKLTGASLRQIDYWTGPAGLLRPSGRPAAGKGSRRGFTFHDLVAIKTIAALRARKCPLQQIRQAVKYLQAHYPEHSSSRMLARLTLLTDGKSVYLLSNRDQIVEVVSQQHVWSVAVGQLILEAEAQVRKLPTEWVEPVKVGGDTYHLRVIRDAETDTFTVQARELPAAIEQGDTVQEAITNGKAVIRSVLDFMSKKRRALGGRRVASAG